MAKIILHLLLISLILNAVTSQTFQYSRGWTNGKRDSPVSWDPTDPCGGVKAFLMVYENGKWQREQVSCEELMKSLEARAPKQRRNVPTDFPFHRRSVPTLDDSNNNNY